MRTFRICGTAELDVNITDIAASTGDEAEDCVDIMDISVDTEGVKCDYCCISRFMCSETEQGELLTGETYEGAEDALYNYRAEGQLEVEVRLLIEADSYGEAVEEAQGLCWDIDSNFSAITLEQTGFEEDDDDCYDATEKTWDDHMSKADRMKFLLGLGCSDDCSYEIAGREGYDVPEDYINQLELCDAL